MHLQLHASRRHGTAFTVMATLALGIAVNLVVFALVNQALLKPLPFPEPHRLLALDTEINGKSSGTSWADVQEMSHAPQLFSGAAAYWKRTWALTDHSGAGLDVVLSGMVTPQFFHVLRTAPLTGTLPDAREGPTDEHTVMLSFPYWQKRYHAQAAVIGSFLSLNDVEYRILGVLPKDFRFPIDGESPDLYIPLSRQDYCCQHEARGLYAIARLAPGTTLASANAHLRALSAHASQQQASPSLAYTATPLQDYLARDGKKTLLLLWLAVSVLGLTAALNAGAILLAKSLREVRQYALKLALGATLRHLLVELLAQAIGLAAAASLTGFGLALVCLHLLRASALFAPLVTGLDGVRSLFDWRVLAFGALLSLLAATSASLLPLLVLRRSTLEGLLRSHAGLSVSTAGRRLRAGLIVTQLALSVTLLSAAASFGHALYALLSRSPGFHVQNVVVAGIGIPEARYDTDDKMIAFHERVLQSLCAIPGVQNAGFGAAVPVHPMHTRFLLDGLATPLHERPSAGFASVSPEVLPILDLPFVRGRNFGPLDDTHHPYVAIVNQAFARRFLSPSDPLGRGLRLSFYNGVSMKPWSHFDLIGIVADSRNSGLDHQPEPEVYTSTQQVPLEGGLYFLATPRKASSLSKELPAAIWRIDPLIQKVGPMPLQQLIGEGYAEKRVLSFLLLAFSFTALLLAALGLGASISAAVTESTRRSASVPPWASPARRRPGVCCASRF